MSFYETMWRTDENGNPISIKKEEKIQVSTIYFEVVLDEIPSAFNGIEVENDNKEMLHEVSDMSNIPHNGFYVDYANGVIKFNPLMSGQVLTFKYYGVGYKRISGKRVVVDGETTEQITTLKKQVANLESQIAYNNQRIEFLIDELSKFLD